MFTKFMEMIETFLKLNPPKTVEEVKTIKPAVDQVIISPKVIDGVGDSAVPIGISKAYGLQNNAAFYDEIRKLKVFGPVFSTGEFNGCEEILKACAEAQWPISYVAYAFATAYHETAHTMQPIKEYGGKAYYTKLYDITGRNPSRARAHGNTTPGDGAKFCGRGYVQLTWKVNYEKASRALGVDFVANPDLAMKPEHAAAIMISGMQFGWFTGKSMKNYLPLQGLASAAQFIKARYIINGVDDNVQIANYAMKFQRALELGKWT